MRGRSAAEEVFMYICICHALTDGDVRSAEAGGAATHSDVFHHFGVVQSCGRCVPSMRSMLRSSDSAGDRRHATDATPSAAPTSRRRNR
jgi:bacterioferritin-associated ferredoxin